MNLTRLGLSLTSLMVIYACQANVVATGKNAVCGDAVAQSGEMCDGDDFGLSDKDCTSFGFTGGDLLCNGTCDGFDTSYCVSATCGNNSTEPGESCDGLDLNGQSCESLGYEGGILACSGDCTELMTTGCFGSGGDTGSEETCGNNSVEGSEVCDGQDLSATTCESLGFDGGVLGCESDCSGFDITSCTNGSGEALCGNGIIESDEQCDGTNLGSDSCVTLGYAGGTLVCNGSCRFDTGGCTEDSGCGCPASFIGDGLCDSDCNNAECNFDGGDCEDPPDCAVGCLATMLADGVCDAACNVADCSYDYGDCSATEECSDLCSGWGGDGYCDLSCNTDLCGWDAGDCCESTCTDGTYSCGGSNGTDYACEDPDACETTASCESCAGLCGTSSPANGLTCSCASDCTTLDNCCLDYADLCSGTDPGTDPDTDTCTGNQSYLSDGWCDGSTNTLGCGWDGGDCCQSTCVDATYTCGFYADFNCLDPTACENTNPADCGCTGPASYIGDGYCDTSTNSASCNWDGGDCCESTCVDSTFTCGFSSYNCQNPAACENSGSGCP